MHTQKAVADAAQKNWQRSSAITRRSGTTALPPPGERAIRIVVGSDWAPFLHEDNEQGGMLTEIANVAMSQADGTSEYKIDFINEWGAHLQPLISDHAYDFSMAWFRPNCDVKEKLGEGSQFRCNILKWSEPMFEQLIGCYSRSADPATQSYADMKGKTICRPAGNSTFMMEENDLVEPLITIVRPNTVVDCFKGLVHGSIDAVVLATVTARGAITEIGAGDLVRLGENLGQIAALHAVISYNHPQADELLAVLDSGLTKIKNSGEWFNIVQRHLAAHRAVNS